MKKLRIALLLGGTSPEREVSKASASAIYPALVSLGHDVILIDPAYGKNQPEDNSVFFNDGDYSEISNRNYVEAVNSSWFDRVDLAFLALHGKWGEDGTIQSLLELRGVSYTGSGVLSSSISMDKLMSKILFQHYNVSTPDWIPLEKSSYDASKLISIIKSRFGFPCVVKPNDQGSTVGLSVCRSESEVLPAADLAFEYSEKVLIEEFIPGHEITVGILENKALPVLEIKPKHDIYDYECKYTSGMSNYIVPADIPAAASEELLKEALLAFNTLGCRGYSRLDFRLDKNYKPYCLEVNTLPGMTVNSLVPKMAKAVGISFEELIDRIIKLSIG